MLGPDAEPQRLALGHAAPGSTGMMARWPAAFHGDPLRTGADTGHGQEVHLRVADELRDEYVLRLMIELHRRADLGDLPPFKTTIRSAIVIASI